MNLIPWKKKLATAELGASAPKPDFAKFKDELKGEVNYGRVLRLLATRAIVKYVVKNTDLPAGDYKIILVPRDGSQFQAIDPKISVSDTVAFKIFEQALHGYSHELPQPTAEGRLDIPSIGPIQLTPEEAKSLSENTSIRKLTSGGLLYIINSEGKLYSVKPLRVGNYRHKSFRSKIEKERMALGADPLEAYSDNHSSLPALEEKIQGVLSRGSLGADQQSDLEFLLGQIKDRIAAREELLYATCGKDAAKKAQLGQTLAKIGEAIERINLLFVQDRAEQSEPLKSLPVKAASLWPIGEKGAAELIGLAGDSAELRDWISRYAKELRRATGVDVLEYTFKESLNDLAHVMERARAEATDKAKFDDSYGHFMQKMHKISSLMDQMDAETDKLNSRLSISSSDLLPLVSIAQKRSDLLALFDEAYRCEGDFCQHNHNKLQIKTMVATMAVNLCKAAHNEAALWRELLKLNLGKHTLEHTLKNEIGRCKALLAEEKKARKNKRGKSLEDSYSLETELKARTSILEAMPKSIAGFAELAEKEPVVLDSLRKWAKGGRTEFKNSLKHEEDALEKHIFDLAEISYPVFMIFLDAYADHRSHTEYKRGRRLNSDPFHYLLPFELLAYTALYSPNEAICAESLSKLGQYAQMNSKILSIAEKHGLKGEVLSYAEQSTYVKERPFDLESDPIQIKEGGYGGKTIRVKYWAGSSPSGKGKINLELGGQIISVPFPSSLTNYYDSKGSQAAPKSLREELYGVKLELKDIVGLKPDETPLGSLYLTLAESAQEAQKFKTVREILRHKHMNTAHFLYLLAAERTLSGSVSSSLGEFPPEILSQILPPAKYHMHEELKKFYPRYDEEAHEAFDYLIWSLRSKVLRELNRSFPYWIGRCVDKIAADEGGKLPEIRDVGAFNLA